MQRGTYMLAGSRGDDTLLYWFGFQHRQTRQETKLIEQQNPDWRDLYSEIL